MKYLKTYQQINEVHYKDKYPQGFHDFHKAWKGSKRYNYYVQFSNHKDNTLDKTSYADTDHSDPKGNYGYPLQYVIDYPMDIWYGSNAKYLRVLQSTAKNILYLNEIKTKDDCVIYLKKIFDSNEANMLELMKTAKKEHRQRLSGSNVWAKTFFQCIQMDYDTNEIRTAEEQTKLFIRGGWDAIRDESRSINSAIINDREPNQIVFLKPTAFKVIEVFTLTDKERVNKHVTSPEHKHILGRKWASLMLNELDGDKIKEHDKTTSDLFFYSVNGREVRLSFQYKDFDKATSGLNIGQKPFKVHKKHDDKIIEIEIITEYGNIDLTMFEDEELSEILSEINHKWSKLKEGDKIENWTPRSLDNKKIADDESKNKAYEERKKKEAEEAIKLFPRWKERVEYWSDKLDIPFKFSDDINVSQRYMKILDAANHILPSHLSKEKVDEEVNKKIEKINLDNEDGRYYLIMLFGEDSDENLENATNYYKIMGEVHKITTDPIIFTFWNYNE